MEYAEIKERLEKVVATTVKPIDGDALARETDVFYKTHQKSLAIYEEAKNYIPGGVEHNLSTTHPYPLAMDRVKGYRMWDVDDNEFIDYLMCGAPIILGHHFDPLDDEIIKIIKEKGPSHGLTSEYELLAAKEIVKLMPSVESVRFLQSGTEANMAAIRLARAYTDKTKIIKISGSYHGWYDQVVYSLHIPGTGPLNSRGILPGYYENLIDVPPNDFDALEKAFEDAKDQGGVAALLLEPVGGESGVHPVHPDWNRRCRELCDAHGTLLVFDEVVTGFRLDVGGAQNYFNITPDLTVLGKIVAHGYPSAGAIAGRKEVMDLVGAGLGVRPYMGGTLAANPISCAACYHALRLIQEHDAVRKASEYADRLTAALNDLFATREDLPFFVYNFGPIMQYVTWAFFSLDITSPEFFEQVIVRRKTSEDYQIVATNKGINTLAGTRMYSCMQHDDEALNRTLEAWEYILSLIPS